MQWGALGQHLNKGPDTMPSYSTVSFGSIYGPRSGDSASVTASKSAAMTRGIHVGTAYLSLPTLIVLGVLAWWIMRQYE